MLCWVARCLLSNAVEEEEGEEGDAEGETRVNALRLRAVDVEAVDEDAGVRSLRQGLQAKRRSKLPPLRSSLRWELLPLNALLNRLPLLLHPPLLLLHLPLLLLQLPGVRRPLRPSQVAFNRFPRRMSLQYLPPASLALVDHAGFASPS